MKPTIDDRQWPILRLTYDGSYTDNELAEFLEEMQVHVNRQETFGILVDARMATRPSAVQRKMITDNSKSPNAHLVALATVTDNALIRGALRAVEWVTHPTYKTRVFASLDDAVAWLHTHVHGTSAPSPAP